jgi:hypothetical protein
VSVVGHHDVNMVRIAPRTMLFVPRSHRVSHYEVKDAAPDDLTPESDILKAARAGPYREAA